VTEGTVQDPARFALFLVASAALIVTPGPAVLYVVARAASQGRRAGLVSMLGVGLGNAVHAIAATLGLAAVLSSSPRAFAAVRYAGAAYLVWLGLRRLAAPEPEGGEATAPDPGARVFRDAVVVAVTNPKTALFFLAFLPQFADPAAPLAPQMLLLGAIFVVMAMASDSTYALLAGAIGAWLRRRPGAAAGGRWASALVYLGLGVVAALSGVRRG
jgi:threonine/homoserine/homoserine lactone efflux protein